MDIVHKMSLKEFRIAPLGYSFIAYGAGISTLGIGVACGSQEADQRINLLFLGTTLASAALTALSGNRLVKRQRLLYRRLEDSLARDGYNERMFGVTTDEWCNRQTARVVCETAGILSEYKELCETRRDTAEMTFLPHI